MCIHLEEEATNVRNNNETMRRLCVSERGETRLFYDPSFIPSIVIVSRKIEKRESRQDRETAERVLSMGINLVYNYSTNFTYVRGYTFWGDFIGFCMRILLDTRDNVDARLAIFDVASICAHARVHAKLWPICILLNFPVIHVILFRS